MRQDVKQYTLSCVGDTLCLCKSPVHSKGCISCAWSFQSDNVMYAGCSALPYCKIILTPRMFYIKIRHMKSK